MTNIERTFYRELHNLEVGVIYKNSRVVCELLKFPFVSGSSRIAVMKLLDKYTRYIKVGQKYIFSEIYLDKIPVEPEKKMILQDGEIVKPFPDCDRYLVSNYGRIWSKPKGDWAHLGSNPNGYLYCSISGKYLSVHRIVALTFIPNPLGLAEVNHKDENKHNNRVDNLEWISRRDNLYYGTRMDRIKAGRNKRRNNPNRFKDRFEKIVRDWKNVGINREEMELMIKEIVDGIFEE